MSYREKLEKMVEELKQHVDIVVDEVHFGEPGFDIDISENIDEDFLQFYREMNGFQLKWHSPKFKDYGYGYISFQPLEEALENGEEVYWLEDYEHWQENFHMIEDMTEGGEEFVGLYPFYEEPEIYIVGEEVRPTGYTFNEYIEALIYSRGLWYWQNYMTVAGPSGERKKLEEIFRELFAEEIQKITPKTNEEFIDLDG